MDKVVKVDFDLSKDLDQITRDAGMGYMQDDDGEVLSRVEYLRKRYAMRRNSIWDNFMQNYWWAYYPTLFVVVGGLLCVAVYYWSKI